MLKMLKQINMNSLIKTSARVSPYTKGTCGCISKKMKLDRPEYKGNPVFRINKK